MLSQLDAKPFLQKQNTVNRSFSNFIAAQSLGASNARPYSIELQRAAAGQHQQYDLQHVREQLDTPEMRRVVNEIQAKVQLYERLHQMQNSRRQNKK